MRLFLNLSYTKNSKGFGVIGKNNILLIVFFVFLATSGCAIFALRTISKADETTTSLNLNRQSLSIIPPDVLALENLEQLRMYKTGLTEVTPEINKLVNLKRLYLGKNELKTLPEEIGDLQFLEVLSLPYNSLDSLPSSIGKLKRLEHLVLDQNNLKMLPDAIGKLPNLKTITVSFNELDTIQPALFDSGSIEIFNLNYNQINSIPREIAKLTNLHELYLENAGFLLELPDELCDIRRFDVLVVDQSIQVPRCLFVRSLHNFRLIIR